MRRMVEKSSTTKNFMSALGVLMGLPWHLAVITGVTALNYTWFID